ncbi:hypothetical protein BB561_006121 [Smittium simulii]|uniref:Uncharacterized protein n=1 Tax=Smittium simulii TaxID=133385 RepID=A0A2T9Y6I0_9FUNG|nr:hypothetical protein BB561_006121 [Smittium simulii]
MPWYKHFPFIKTSPNASESINSLPNRKVYLNIPVPDQERPSHMSHYCTNEVFSAQYTFITFIPKNLFRQFQRFANLFFLLMAIVGSIPTFTSSPPGLSVIPIITIITLTAIKDAFEDWRRHVSDRIANDRVVDILSNFDNKNIVKPSQLTSNSLTYNIKKALGINQKNEIPGFWLDKRLYPYSEHSKVAPSSFKLKAVRVGDVVLLKAGDPAPADLLILGTSHEEAICYADSKDLDGETSLKSRSAIKGIPHIFHYSEINKVKLVAEASPPNDNMFVFNMNVSVLDENNTFSTYPADIKNVLFRDMIVRNTDWVLGLILYTGGQTKVILNTGPPKFKTSRIEKTMNNMIVINFVFLFIASLAISIIGTTLYIGTDKNLPDNLFVDGSYSAITYFFLLFISSLFMLQNCIPISLYISVELVKLAHAYFIYYDIQMYYENKNIPCSPKNWSISDDLGQIEYVFSDKTGTLTNNVMTFRMCSINGIVYGKQLPDDALDVDKGIKATSAVTENQRLISSSSDLIQTLNQSDLPDMPSVSKNIDSLKTKMITAYQSALKTVYSPKFFSLQNLDQIHMQSIYSFVDPNIFYHMKHNQNNNSAFFEYPSWTSPQNQSEMIDLFMTQLMLNHSAVIDKNNKLTLQSHNSTTQPESASNQSQKSSCEPSTISSSIPNGGEIYYSAESPDECALVLAARNFGYTFLSKKSNTITVDLHGSTINYEVLATIEFDSVRKRMSSIVCRPHPYNDIVVFCKGADTVMLDLLYPLNENDTYQVEMRKKVFEQIDSFAASGLRTLIFAHKIISNAECTAFLEKYKKAQSYIGSDRQDVLDAVAASLENNFSLTGCTAIEDRLQEKVADCIASLRSAGIKVWVLTGDKMETAINIGFAANLLTKSMELWTIDGKQSDQETIEKFWLISKLVRETHTNFAGSNAEIISLHPKETKLLDRISYQVKKASKYILYLGRRKETKMSQNELASQSIQHLQTHRYNTDQNLDNNNRYQNLDFEYSNEGSTDVNSISLQVENALVVDGRALKVILEDERSKQELAVLAPLFKSVICTRVSPLQKAQVVKHIKTSLNVITLAVGDGANDVSMIQAANVGVAIVGEEGLQAANAADYSFGRFHFLQNLILVHGLFDYLRVSETVLTFFYKNNIWALTPLWYTFYSRFSANYFFNLVFVQFYNLFFTSLPVIVLGWMDKPYNYKTAMIYAKAYKSGIKNEYFGYKRYTLYSLEGIVQSLAIFMIMTYSGGDYNSFIQNNGKIWSGYDYSSGVACAIVLVASFFVVLNIWQMNWLFYISIIFSIGAVFFVTGIIGLFPSLNAFGLGTALLGSLTFWLSLVVTIVITLLSRYVYTYIDRGVKPSDIEIIKEIKVLHKPWYGQVYIEKTDTSE